MYIKAWERRGDAERKKSLIFGIRDKVKGVIFLLLLFCFAQLIFKSRSNGCAHANDWVKECESEREKERNTVLLSVHHFCNDEIAKLIFNHTNS